MANLVESIMEMTCEHVYSVNMKGFELVYLYIQIDGELMTLGNSGRVWGNFNHVYRTYYSKHNNTVV
jgi:hypothetical protein